jgi:hypothetical protein
MIALRDDPEGVPRSKPHYGGGLDSSESSYGSVSHRFDDDEDEVGYTGSGGGGGHWPPTATTHSKNSTGLDYHQSNDFVPQTYETAVCLAMASVPPVEGSTRFPSYLNAMNSFNDEEDEEEGEDAEGSSRGRGGFSPLGFGKGRGGLSARAGGRGFASSTDSVDEQPTARETAEERGNNHLDVEAAQGRESAVSSRKSDSEDGFDSYALRGSYSTQQLQLEEGRRLSGSGSDFGSGNLDAESHQFRSPRDHAPSPDKPLLCSPEFARLLQSNPRRGVGDDVKRNHPGPDIGKPASLQTNSDSNENSNPSSRSRPAGSDPQPAEDQQEDPEEDDEEERQFMMRIRRNIGLSNPPPPPPVPPLALDKGKQPVPHDLPPPKIVVEPVPTERSAGAKLPTGVKPVESVRQDIQQHRVSAPSFYELPDSPRPIYRVEVPAAKNKDPVDAGGANFNGVTNWTVERPLIFDASSPPNYSTRLPVRGSTTKSTAAPSVSKHPEPAPQPSRHAPPHIEGFGSVISQVKKSLAEMQHHKPAVPYARAQATPEKEMLVSLALNRPIQSETSRNTAPASVSQDHSSRQQTITTSHAALPRADLLHQAAQQFQFNMIDDEPQFVSAAERRLLELEEKLQWERLRKVKLEQETDQLTYRALGTTKTTAAFRNAEKEGDHRGTRTSTTDIVKKEAPFPKPIFFVVDEAECCRSIAEYRHRSRVDRRPIRTPVTPSELLPGIQPRPPLVKAEPRELVESHRQVRDVPGPSNAGAPVQQREGEPTRTVNSRAPADSTVLRSSSEKSSLAAAAATPRSAAPQEGSVPGLTPASKALKLMAEYQRKQLLERNSQPQQEQQQHQQVSTLHHQTHFGLPATMTSASSLLTSILTGSRGANRANDVKRDDTRLGPSSTEEHRKPVTLPQSTARVLLQAKLEQDLAMQRAAF